MHKVIQRYYDPVICLPKETTVKWLRDNRDMLEASRDQTDPLVTAPVKRVRVLIIKSGIATTLIGEVIALCVEFATELQFAPVDFQALKLLTTHKPRIALCIDGGRLLPLTERSVPLSVHAYEAGGFPEWDNIFAEKHLRIMDLKSAVEINALFSRFRTLRRLDLLQPRLKSVSTVHVPSNIKVIIERFRFPPGVAFSFPDLHLENKPHELHCDIWIITPRLRAMERLSLIIKSGQFTIIGLHIELFYHGLEQNWDEVSPLRVALSSATTVTTMSLNFDILLYKFEHLPYSLKTLHVDCDHYEETYLPTNNDHPRHPRTDSLTRWIDADNWGKRNSLNLEHLIIRSQSADPLEKNDGCQQLMKSCKARGIMMTFRPQLEVLGCRFPALTSNYDNYGLPKFFPPFK